MLVARGELGVLIARDTGPRLALVGALGTAVAFLLFYAGTSRTSAIEAALCLQVEPVYALIGAWVGSRASSDARRIVVDRGAARGTRAGARRAPALVGERRLADPRDAALLAALASGRAARSSPACRRRC